MSAWNFAEGTESADEYPSVQESLTEELQCVGTSGLT